jgi:hypothetical protein
MHRELALVTETKVKNHEAVTRKRENTYLAGNLCGAAARADATRERQREV